jgi:hypothetical protein
VLPVPDQHLCLEECVELLNRQNLVAHVRTEGLHERVLPRRSWLDVARSRARETASVSKRVGGQLGSVV